MRNNHELGSLSKQLYLCRYKVSHEQPSLPVQRGSDGRDWDPPFFPHTCEYQNSIIPLYYFSIDEVCQAFQSHLWAISDLCDFLVYIFAFLLKVSLMSELLPVVSASFG